MPETACIIFAISLTSYVYSVVLIERGMILNGYYLLMCKLFGKWPFIFKPLVDCYICVSGQFGLWGYLLLTDYYVWSQHIIYVSGSIFCSIIINKFYEWLKN